MITFQSLRRDLTRWFTLNVPRLMRKATTAAYCGIAGFAIMVVGLMWAFSQWMPSGLIGWTMRGVVGIGALSIGFLLMAVSMCYWLEGNLRASRQTELAEQYPIHVVCAWLGNSPDVEEALPAIASGALR